MAESFENYEVKKFRLFNPDDLIDICSVIESLLLLNNRSVIIPLIQTAIIELSMNGFKAYDKREFFNKNGLNFNLNYQQGMEFFVKKFHEEQNADEVIVREFPVFLEIKISKRHFYLSVETKIEMHEEERKAVLQIQKMTLDQEESIEVEGGGMGIRMIMAMLDNLKLDRNCFSFQTDNKRTVFTLALNFQ